METISIILVSILRLVNGHRSHSASGLNPGAAASWLVSRKGSLSLSPSACDAEEGPDYKRLSACPSSKGAIQESSQVREYVSSYMKHVCPTPGHFGDLKNGVKPFTLFRI